MDKQLQVFNHTEFGELEIWINEGKEFFPATDAAKLLGYVNPHDALSKHCKQSGVAFREVIDSLGRAQQKKYINEGNLYRLITRSQLAEAEKFESWIFDEVLPMIRKTGMYVTDNVWEQINNDPARFGELLIQYGEAKKELEEKTKTLHILMHVNKTYTSTEIAKELGFKSATALNKDLGEKKIQFKQNGTWVLFSKYADKGYVDIKQEVLDNGRVIYHRRWTQTGREFLVKLYGGIAA